MDKNLIPDWIKKETLRAMEMPASVLLQTYRESLRHEDNPLSGIFENELLRRLWMVSYAND